MHRSSCANRMMHSAIANKWSVSVGVELGRHWAQVTLVPVSSTTDQVGVVHGEGDAGRAGHLPGDLQWHGGDPEGGRTRRTLRLMGDGERDDPRAGGTGRRRATRAGRWAATQAGTVPRRPSFDRTAVTRPLARLRAGRSGAGGPADRYTAVTLSSTRAPDSVPRFMSSNLRAGRS